jgi:signal transduction histidine kinase
MLVGASRAGHATPLGWDFEGDVKAPAIRRAALVGAMIMVVAAVAGLAYWDAERESAAALQDFAQEQATLASALGALIRTRAQQDPAAAERDVLRELGSIEREHALAILVRPPGASGLRATDGAEVASPRLLAALRGPDSIIRIPREEAGQLGLPARTALAGLSRVQVGAGRTWDVVAVASAERLRDRQARARRRLFLSVFAAVGLTLAFGGAAMRLQRNELVLERELAISELQQRRDERLQRADRAAVMGTLAMGVAHEISTPLGVIAARAEQILPRVEGDERLAGNVRSILSQTERIDQIVRGLLGLARGDAPAMQRIAARSLVDNAVALVEHRFTKAGVRLAQEVDREQPALLGDPRLLEHAVVNLLLNACDACKSSGEVVIKTRRSGDELEIAVEDSGAGMSLADIGRAREPFFTTKGREGGTGLGLAIAHEIVANHRGRLTFSPLEPRGTRAAIFLPPAEGDARG